MHRAFFWIASTRGAPRLVRSSLPRLSFFGAVVGGGRCEVGGNEPNLHFPPFSYAWPTALPGANREANIGTRVALRVNVLETLRCASPGNGRWWDGERDVGELPFAIGRVSLGPATLRWAGTRQKWWAPQCFGVFLAVRCLKHYTPHSIRRQCTKCPRAPGARICFLLGEVFDWWG